MRSPIIIGIGLLLGSPLQAETQSIGATKIHQELDLQGDAKYVLWEVASLGLETGIKRLMESYNPQEVGAEIELLKQKQVEDRQAIEAERDRAIQSIRENP